MALLLIQTYVQWLYLSKGIVEAEEQYTLTGPLNPVITIASILIFIGFANMTIKHDLSKLASVSFLVYLIHIFVLQNIEHIMAKPMFANEGWICIPAEAIIVFIASYVLALLYLKIKKLLLRTAQQISV